MPIPRLSESQPIMDNIPIQSDAAGQEALASAFGDVGHEFFNVAKEGLQTINTVKKQESNAMLASALNDETKNTYDAKIKMIQNPNMGNQILESAQNNSNAILQNAKLNREDQQRLKMVMTESQGQLGVDNAHEQYDIYKRMAFIKQYDDYTGLLDQIQKTAGNPEAQKVLIDTASQLSASAVRNGIITPEHYDVQHRTLMAIVNQQQTIASYPVVGKPRETDEGQTQQTTNDNNSLPSYSRDKEGLDVTGNVSPQDHHQMHFNPLDPSQNVKATAPVNQDLKYGYLTLNDNGNLHDIRSSLMQGVRVTSTEYSRITGKEQYELGEMVKGTAVAERYIGPGSHLDAVKNRYDELTGKDKNLSIAEQAERDRLGYYLGQFKNGNGTQQILENSGGAAIIDNWKKSVDAINRGNFDPKVKAQKINDADNQYASNVVSYAMTSGIPLNQVNPISTSMTNQAQSAFKMSDPNFPGQGDPNSLIKTLQYYKREMRPFVAQTIKNPIQQQVALSASYLMSKPSTAYNQDHLKTWIRACQDGGVQSTSAPAINKLSNVLHKEYVPGDKILAVEVNHEISDTLDYIQKLPNGGNNISAITTGAVNYVKQRCLDNNDPEMKNRKIYEQEISDLLKKSYDVQKGSMSYFNKNQVDLTPHQVSLIEEYAKDKLYKTYGSGMTSKEYEDTLDITPVVITLNPYGNQIVVKESNSTNVALTFPYDRKILTVSQKMIDDRENDK